MFKFYVRTDTLIQQTFVTAAVAVAVAVWFWLCCCGCAAEAMGLWPQLVAADVYWFQGA